MTNYPTSDTDLHVLVDLARLADYENGHRIRDCIEDGIVSGETDTEIVHTVCAHLRQLIDTDSDRILHAVACRLVCDRIATSEC